MTDLSPAAQAVMDAAVGAYEPNVIYEHRISIAAALRAAADQVVPETVPSDQPWNDVMAQRCVIRFELLAIALELEAAK